jgi:uncharacterized protein (TIGR02001 family)
MKRLGWILALGAALLVGTAGAASAEEAEEEEEKSLIPGGFSATISFYNNYLWRGLTQTDDEVALQAGIDWKHDSGFYVGIWGSNVEVTDSIQIELDVYGGYGGDIGDTGLSYDVGFITYTYPTNNSDSAFAELYGGLSYEHETFSTGATYSISPKPFQAWDGADTEHHIVGNADVPLPLPEIPVLDGASLSGNVGYFTFGRYVHWDAGLTLTIVGFDVDFRYADTNLDSGPDEDARFIVGFSREF